MIPILIAIIVMCLLYVWYVHSTLKKEFEEQSINLESEEDESDAEIF